MENATMQKDAYTRRVDAEIQRLIQDDDWYEEYMRYMLHINEEVARESKKAREEAYNLAYKEAYEQAFQEAYEEGLREAREQSLNDLLSALTHALQDAGRQDELFQAVTDLDYRKKLLAEFGIT